MKTIAAILEKQHAPLVIKELEIPPLKEGQVLVQMAYTGLCHSQLNEIGGLKGHDPYLPHTLGHEGSGIVLETGPGVNKTKAGDHVVLSWIKGKGADVSGVKYSDGDRWVNSGPISTFLTHAIISENRVFPIPVSMPLREASLLGCAIPTGAGVIFNQMKIKAGQSIAIFGLGGIGLSALLAAQYVGAEPIVAVDISEEKLVRSKQLGASHTINASVLDPYTEIMAITNSKGVDFSLEAAGRKEAMEIAYRVLNPLCGVSILAGNLPQGQKIEIDPFDLIKGKKIFGTWGGGGDMEKDIQNYVRLFSDHSMPLNHLITHEVGLFEINDLYELMVNGKVGRGIIKFQ